LKIALIDDEPIVIKGFKVMLKRIRPDYEDLVEAMDGISALSLVREIKPNIVITDIHMPGLDGISFIESVKNELPSSVFIIISGYQKFEYARRAISLGILDYLDKPVTLEKLEKTLFKAEERIAINEKEKQYSAALIDRLTECIYSGDTESAHEKMIEILERNVGSSENYYRFMVYQLVDTLAAVFPAIDVLAFRNAVESRSLDSIEYTRNLFMQTIDVEIQKYKGIYQHPNREMILKMLSCIHTNYKAGFGLNEIAGIIGNTPSYLSMLFKETMGENFIKYLTDLRIDHAKSLLRNGVKSGSVGKIVGYRYPRYFLDVFKKNTGYTPREYKNIVSNRNNDNENSE
jgi:two-component system response regulator YesN